MTTDDLVPPPPRLIIEIEEIIFSVCDTPSIKDQIDLLQRISSNPKYEDVKLTLQLQENYEGVTKVTYVNGFKH